MKYKVIFVFVVLLVCVNFAYAGNNTTDANPRSIDEKYSDVIVKAEEDGHLDINFSDGSKGYCLEYGEHEAKKGDEFYAVNTGYAVNNNDNQSISKYLKCLFIDHYNYTQSMPPVYIQHMIWYFSDDFYHPTSIGEHMDIVNSIKNCTCSYPDSGYKIINSTTAMFYDFQVMMAKYENHQNYFNYNIHFGDIPQNSTNNTEDNKNSTDINNTNMTRPDRNKNETSPIHNKKTADKNTAERTSVSKETGGKINALVCVVLLMFTMAFIARKR